MNSWLSQEVKNTIASKKRVAVIGVVVVLLSALGVQLHNFLVNLNGYPWDRDLIEDYLETSIPVDAKNVKFDGHRGRGGGLDLEFEASQESIATFVSHFCKNTLYQGYDPFNAIDRTDQHEGDFLIRMGQVSYYSYSPDTSDKQFGIRCLNGGMGQIQILVEKTSEHIALLKMEVLFTCYKCNI